MMDLVGGYILGVVCIYLAPDAQPLSDDESSALPESRRVGNRKVAWNYAAGAGRPGQLRRDAYPWGLLLLWPAAAGDCGRWRISGLTSASSEK